MSTEFNYVVNVNTTRVMGAMSDIRSQIGMAFGSAGGFSGAAGALPGGGFGAGAAASGAVSGFNQMLGGLSRGYPFAGMSMGVGRHVAGTFTDPGIANVPHYGMYQAETTLAQELRIRDEGLSAAKDMRPAGVSAVEYAAGVQRNHIERNLEARTQSIRAGSAAFASGVVGLAGWTAGEVVGGGIGSAAGGALFGKMFGAGGAGAGKFIGGMAGGMGLGIVVGDAMAGYVEDKFAEAEQTVGISKELGQIVGAGRGLSRVDRFKLGRAAYGAADDAGISHQAMGDIMALARTQGMLPDSKSPDQARDDYKKYAQAIDEGAQVLHTSLAKATSVIKSATQQGLTAEQGIMQAAGMGGADAFMRYQAFGGMGSQYARSARMTGGMGFGVFTSALGQMAGAGMTGEEMKILGGRESAAQMLGATQMAAVGGPLGDMQLMAAMGGQALGGAMDLPMQAIGAMSQGDMLSNLGNFMINKDDIRRGLSAKDVRTMSRQQVVAGGESYAELFPGMTERGRQRLWAQGSYGMNPTQAEAYVGGLFSSGGGVNRDMALGRQAIAAQGMLISRYAVDPSTDKTIGGYITDTLGDTKKMAMYGAGTGFVIGGPKGAIAGGAAAAAVSLGYRAWDFGSDLLDFGGDLYDTGGNITKAMVRQEERQLGRADAAEQAFNRKHGILTGVDPMVIGTSARADLSGAYLDIDDLGGVAGHRMAARMTLGGYSQVAGGPGAIALGGGFFSTADVQKEIASNGTSRKLDAETKERLANAGWATGRVHHGGRDGTGASQAMTFVGEYNKALGGDPGAVARAKRAAVSLVRSTPDEAVRDEILADIEQNGLGRDGKFFTYLGGVPGVTGLGDPNNAATLALGLGAATGTSRDKAMRSAAQAIVDQHMRWDEPTTSAHAKGALDLVRASMNTKEWASGDYEAGMRAVAMANPALGKAIPHFKSMPTPETPIGLPLTPEEASNRRRVMADTANERIGATGVMLTELLTGVNPGKALAAMPNLGKAALEGNIGEYLQLIGSQFGDVADPDAPGSKKKKSKVHQVQVGFGEQETAMQTIQRTLDLTRRGMKRVTNAATILETRLATLEGKKGPKGPKVDVP